MMAPTEQAAKSLSVEGILHTLLALDLTGKSRAIQEKLVALEQKLSKGQLHLAVLGQMKRGKSSLINALLRAKVLPTGILPATAIITEMRYGNTPTATVVYTTGGMRESVTISALSDYITEVGNPGNKKQVASVEVTYPSLFLEGGIVLIDTPGIGSTHAHNTDTTERYLSEVDAGIVVLSVDPPVTELESKFIRDLRQEVPKLIFVLSKTDTASPAEVDEIIKFLATELDRLGIPSPEIFPLSAHRDLAANGQTENGLATFEQRLRTFLSQEKQQVLVHSVAMDLAEIARTLRFAASIGARAGAMSEEDLRNKKAALDRMIAEIEVDIRELRILLRQGSSDLLGGVEGDLTAHVQESVPKVQQHLGVFNSRYPRDTGRAFGALLEDFLMQEVEAVFTRWRIHEDEKIQKQMAMLSDRFVARANGILARLERFAGALFEIPVEHLIIRCPLRVESHLRFRVERIFYSLDSFLLFLPRFLLRPIIFRRTRGNVPLLLDTNAGRIRFDYLERLQASISKFEKDLIGTLETVASSLRSALEPQPKDGQQSETADLGILDSVLHDCATLLR